MNTWNKNVQNIGLYKMERYSMTKDLANLARAIRARDICNEEIEKYDYVIDSIVILEPNERDSNNLNTLIVARNKWVKAKTDVETTIRNLESS